MRSLVNEDFLVTLINSCRISDRLASALAQSGPTTFKPARSSSPNYEVLGLVSGALITKLDRSHVGVLEGIERFVGELGIDRCRSHRESSRLVHLCREISRPLEVSSR